MSHDAVGGARQHTAHSEHIRITVSFGPTEALKLSFGSRDEKVYEPLLLSIIDDALITPLCQSGWDCVRSTMCQGHFVRYLLQLHRLHQTLTNRN